MKISIISPTKACLLDYTPDELYDLRKALTYENTSVKFLIGKHSKNWNWKQRNLDSWQSHLDALKLDLKKCLVFEDEQGLYIRPGSIPYLTQFNLEIENHIIYPKAKKLPFFRPLPFKLHLEQEQSCQRLPEQKHGNASLCTGFGKSIILLKICEQMGLTTCIVAPSKSIFEELVEKFEYHFGKKYIGTFGAGKKKLEGKRFIIAIGDSLANIKLNSPEYDFFSKLEVLMVDESHTFGAESLETICHGVLSNIPYRFFLSATQTRNDGAVPLLQSIIGKTICELGTEEAVLKKYICKHDYKIIAVESSNSSIDVSDPLAQKRIHFLNNSNIAQFIAKLANAMATAQGKQTLVLCEELSQLAMLAPLLTVPYALAHSEKRKERLEELGLEKVEVSESIEKFNKNEVKVLITTSCCHVGVNLYPTHSTCNWVGGSSSIKTKQSSIGRSVRHGHSNPWAAKCMPKDKATIYDFDVNNRTMERHLETRIECYKESGEGLIKYIRLK